MAEKLRFCVLGAGHGGTAMAAHLALMGFEVNLYNRSRERIEPIIERGGIELLAHDVEAAEGGEARLGLVTDDCGAAMADADVLMVVVPAMAHRFMAEQMAPHLRDGQTVVLNPGRTGGALEVRHVLNEMGCTADILLAEAQTLIYAARATGPAQTQIFSLKNNVPVAALPGHRTAEVVRVLRTAFPQFVAGDNVLKTSLNNVAVMFHPTVLVMNAGRVEDTLGDFEYYLQGITPSIAHVLERVDEERIRVAEALGLHATGVKTWLYVSYDAAGRTLYDAVHAHAGYKGIKAPATLQHRYILEDVPTSLVPMISLGEELGVDMTTMRSIANIACLLVGQDLWAEGRTVETLGLKGLTVRQIRRLVMDGEPGEP